MRTALAAVLALTALACEPRRDKMIVRWTFEGGKTCADAGITQVQVDVAGQTLSPNTFACANGGQINGGADLGTYLDGTYKVTLSGLDAYGDAVDQITADVRVGPGGVDVTIDVPRVISSATLHWTFGGKTCAQAGVTVVHVNVDGQPLTDGNNNPDIACSQGGIDGSTIEPLTPGAHTFDVAGLVNGAVAYQGTFSVNVVAAKDTVAAVDLPAATPTSATAFLTFDFGGRDCQAAGVDHIYVLFDPAANGSGGTASGDFACLGTDGKPVTSTVIDGVPEGTHSFAIRGSRGGLLAYYTHQPPSTLFQIGLESDLYVPAQPTP